MMKVALNLVLNAVFEHVYKKECRARFLRKVRRWNTLDNTKNIGMTGLLLVFEELQMYLVTLQHQQYEENYFMPGTDLQTAVNAAIMNENTRRGKLLAAFEAIHVHVKKQMPHKSNTWYTHLQGDHYHSYWYKATDGQPVPSTPDIIQMQDIEEHWVQTVYYDIEPLVHFLLHLDCMITSLSGQVMSHDKETAVLKSILRVTCERLTKLDKQDVPLTQVHTVLSGWELPTQAPVNVVPTIATAHDEDDDALPRPSRPSN